VVANPFRIKVVSGGWNPPPDGAVGNWPWPVKMIRAVFQDPNGWSVRDYWQRASFGILNPEFDLSEVGALPMSLADLDANWLSHHRSDAIEAVRARARSEDLHVDGYDGFVALVNPPPSDAGAWGRNALLDQNGYLEFFQHEIGHVLGLDHAFGWSTGSGSAPVPYADDYCVMGYTGPQSFTVPTPPEASSVVTPLPGNFWQSGRRVSAANLYRSFPNEMSPWVTRFTTHEKAIVGAASAVAEIGTPVPARPLAVISLSGTGVPGPPDPELAIEYRVPTVDDRGVTPAVVVHSIGLRGLGPGVGEVRPVVLEGTLQPVAGQSLQVQRSTVTVTSNEFPGTGLGRKPPVVVVSVSSY
jgi:hypothetical protein